MDITFGVVPLVTQFVTYSYQIHQLFEASKDAGRDFSQLETEFMLEMQVLRTWAMQRGLDDQKNIHLNPQEEERYALALKILAIIVTILVDANPLRDKFRKGASLDPAPQRGRLNLSVPKIFRSSSKSPSRTRSPSPSPENRTYLQELDKLGLRGNSSIKEQLDVLGKYSFNIQENLSVPRKFGWAFSGKGKLESLVGQLKRWNEALDRLDLPLKASKYGQVRS